MEDYTAVEKFFFWVLAVAGLLVTLALGSILWLTSAPLGQ